MSQTVIPQNVLLASQTVIPQNVLLASQTVIPMSRQSLQQLNYINNEAQRLDKINTIVENIYNKVIHYAKHSQCKKFEFPIPRENNKPPGYVGYSNLMDDFYNKNLSDIILNLQKVFPDCDVSHLIMTKGSDGKLYDIAKIDDKILPLITIACNDSYIVINWS